MKPFAFQHAVSAADAIAAVSESGGAYLAGGTNLVDLMKNGVVHPDRLVDIRRLGLAMVEPTASGGVCIGSGVTNSALANHPLIRSQYPVVSHAILSGATTQLRNMATVGGNLLQRTRCPYFMQPEFSQCNKRQPGTGCAALGGFHREHAIFGASTSCVATNPSDMAVALSILDAVVHVEGADGPRSIPFGDFHTLPGCSPEVENSLRPGELILAVELPPSPYADRSWYLKLRDRHSYAFALVSAAVGLDLTDGVITSAAVALGAVAAIPWRVPAAEEALIGRRADPEAFEAAAQLAIEGAEPLQQNAFKVPLARQAIIRALSRAATASDSRD